jgi:hypothetical protein
VNWPSAFCRIARNANLPTHVLYEQAEVPALGRGTHGESYCIRGVIGKVNISALVELSTLFFGGDAAKQLGHLVASNQRTIDDSLLSMQHHYWRVVRLQSQLRGALASHEVEQIVHAIHSGHAEQGRAPGPRLQLEDVLTESHGLSAVESFLKLV